MRVLGRVQPHPCDFGQDQVTIEDVEANLYPEVVAVWIDPSVGRLLQPFHFTEPPSIHAGGTIQLKNGSTNDLHIRIDAPNRFTYHFGGWEIPFSQGSGDFSVIGTDSTNLSVSGTVMRARGEDQRVISFSRHC